MQLHEHGMYRNGRGDLIGPMTQHGADTFKDQHGNPYHANGRLWSHHPESTGNIVRYATTDKPRTGWNREQA